MPLFKRILKEPEPVAIETPRVERRSTKRYAINPQFPLKAVLSLIARDDTGAPMSHSRHGWNWKGRLIDCSEQGVRIQMGPVIKASIGEPCDLMLSVEDFELTIPCHIVNTREQDEGMVFGLKHDIENDATRNTYRQLIEVVALGSTLKPQARHTKPDDSGYLVERYASDRPACLSIWRHPADQSVAAFEFQLKDNLVRASAGQTIEYLTGADAAAARKATPAQSTEIQWLFQWVVSNLAPVVPADVREFLQYYAT